ncbi:hypothetical protein [Secundilactobacillus muriivasis]
MNKLLPNWFATWLTETEMAPPKRVDGIMELLAGKQSLPPQFKRLTGKQRLDLINHAECYIAFLGGVEWEQNGHQNFVSPRNRRS